MAYHELIMRREVAMQRMTDRHKHTIGQRNKFLVLSHTSCIILLTFYKNNEEHPTASRVAYNFHELKCEINKEA